MTEFLQSWQGFIGVGAQLAALGAKAVPTIFADPSVADVSLSEKRPGLELVPAVRGGAVGHFATRRRGFINVSGGFSGPLYPDDLMTSDIFAYLLGNNNAVSGDVSNGFTHTFSEPSALGSYPEFGATIQAFLGGIGNTMVRDHIACFLNTYSLTIPEEGDIVAATEWVGRNTEDGGVKATPSYTAVSPFESFMGKLKIGATLGTVISFDFVNLELNFTRNVSMIQQHDGNCTRFPTGRMFGIPTLEFTWTKKATDDITLHDFFKNEEFKAVEITLKHDALSGASPGSEYEIVFKIPKMIIKDSEVNLAGDPSIDEPYTYEALQDEASGFTVEITSKNSVAGVYVV